MLSQLSLSAGTRCPSPPLRPQPAHPRPAQPWQLGSAVSGQRSWAGHRLSLRVSLRLSQAQPLRLTPRAQPAQARPASSVCPSLAAASPPGPASSAPPAAARPRPRTAQAQRLGLSSASSGSADPQLLSQLRPQPGSRSGSGSATRLSCRVLSQLALGEARPQPAVPGQLVLAGQARSREPGSALGSARSARPPQASAQPPCSASLRLGLWGSAPRAQPAQARQADPSAPRLQRSRQARLPQRASASSSPGSWPGSGSAISGSATSGSASSGSARSSSATRLGQLGREQAGPGCLISAGSSWAARPG